MKEIIVKAKDLCKSFANNGLQNHVLRNIDLEVYKGDFTVVMGISGSGKSTLLYNISGMDRPTSGEVWFSEKRIDNMQEKRLAVFRRVNVGFVFQQIHLVSNLSIYENVTVPGYLTKKHPRRTIEARANELLDQTGMKEFKNRLPSQLSGGQQQKAAISRSLINDPALIFADEPTGALNSKSGREILNILTDLNRNGRSVMMVTHDVKAAIRANRIIYLHDGQVTGEMSLDPYMPDAEQDRERQVLSWLTSKGW